MGTFCTTRGVRSAADLVVVVPILLLLSFLLPLQHQQQKVSASSLLVQPFRGLRRAGRRHPRRLEWPSRTSLTRPVADSFAGSRDFTFAGQTGRACWLPCNR